MSLLDCWDSKDVNWFFARITFEEVFVCMYVVDGMFDMNPTEYRPTRTHELFKSV